MQLARTFVHFSPRDLHRRYRSSLGMPSVLSATGSDGIVSECRILPSESGVAGTASAPAVESLMHVGGPCYVDCSLVRWVCVMLTVCSCGCLGVSGGRLLRSFPFRSLARTPLGSAAAPSVGRQSVPGQSGDLEAGPMREGYAREGRVRQSLSSGAGPRGMEDPPAWVRVSRLSSCPRYKTHFRGCTW